MRGFYGERFKLQETLTDEQRTWQEEQLTWQEDSIKMQQGYNAEMDIYQDKLKEIQRTRDEGLASIEWWLLGGGEAPAGAGGKGALMPTFLDALQDGSTRAQDIADWISKWTPPDGGGDGTGDGGGGDGDGDDGNGDDGVVQSIRLRSSRLQSVRSPTQETTLSDVVSLLSQILASNLQLANALNIKLEIDGQAIAHTIQPYIDSAIWDQAFLQ